MSLHTTIEGVVRTDIVYALDTAGETKYSSEYRERLASHVWKLEYCHSSVSPPLNGVVTKDNGGLFASVNNQPVNSTPTFYYYVNGVQTPFSPSDLDFFTDTQEPNKVVAKCECGAHTVGSNKHSSWCEIKENA